MNNLIIPKEDIKRLEESRIALYDLCKNYPNILNKLPFGISDIMWIITHTKYKEI